MLSILLPALAAATPVAAPQPVRLYTLDCGHLDLDDMGLFSDAHRGERGQMAVPCYLVRDGNRWLLWDTGLGDRLAAYPNGRRIMGGQWTVRHTLRGQLARLGLRPDRIHYVALSHLHADHSGNVGLFPHATILLGAPELAWAKTGGLGTDPAIVRLVGKARVRMLGDDTDVFGDGRVRIVATPGHTPGHRSLLVDLPRAGPILITGDLAHTHENLATDGVPRINTDAAQTRASFARFKALAAQRHARIIVQHAPEDFARMPRFPAYLD